jgi:hypothetical protein
MRAADLFKKSVREYRKRMTPPYSLGDLISILAVIFVIFVIPLTVYLSITARDFRGKAATGTSGIGLGVDAYVDRIASEPTGLTYVYKYILSGYQNLIQPYMNSAYQHNFKPVFVMYTNSDSNPPSPDFTTYDAVMNAIRTDGREAWVIVEPDMWGIIRSDGNCGTTGKSYVDRYMSTKPSNVHLGFFMSGWNMGDGTQSWNWPPDQEAADWKTCWNAAGGQRMEGIYFDVSDRDQEWYSNNGKGVYPWTSAHITMWENFAREVYNQTGRKVGVWQIPMGNTQCANGHRSNIVETWLNSDKLAALSPYVDKLLFGPGVENGNGDYSQTWNLPGDTAYDCGFFNQQVALLTSEQGDTQSPTVSVTAPSSGQTVSGTVTVTATASDNVGVSKVEFYIDSTLKSTDTSPSYSYSWGTTGYSNASHTLSAIAYDAAGNASNPSSVSVTVNNTCTKVGDLNCDNFVSVTDLQTLINNWSASSGVADINKDGVVNILDLSILLSHWGL